MKWTLKGGGKDWNKKNVSTFKLNLLAMIGSVSKPLLVNNHFATHLIQRSLLS